MMSTKPYLPIFTLVLVVFTVFTVSLTETIQISDGLSMSATRLIYELEPGETQMIVWQVQNNHDVPYPIEFYAEGKGSEYLIFEKYIDADAHEIVENEIYVQIPENHPTDVEYRVKLYALQIGEKPEGGAASGAVVNVQVLTNPVIKIGANPIYYDENLEPPTISKEMEEIPVDIDPQPTTPEEVEVEEAEETLEEKLARIQSANQQFEETQIDDSFEEDPFVEDESIMFDLADRDTDTDYIPEPEIDNEMNAVDSMNGEEEGGGCLIATATFGSELAPQVQLLREIRDNQLMGTGSGIAFMTGFNSLYYSFSPTIADMERESPAFKELVKITITPMISTLSIMKIAETESEVLGLGIGVILMNLGMYVGLPAFGIVKLIQFRKN